MMTDLPSSPRCRHDYQPITTWDGITPTAVTTWVCARCGRERDEERARRGRHSLRAGKDAERAIARAYGGTRTGQAGGPDDVLVGDLFVVQSKARAGAAFPGWMWDELAKLPRAGGRIPTLIVSDRPGPGHRTRRLVVRMMDDDVALHGPETRR